MSWIGEFVVTGRVWRVCRGGRLVADEIDVCDNCWLSERPSGSDGGVHRLTGVVWRYAEFPEHVPQVGGDVIGTPF